MHCKHCGSKIDNDSKFCQSCGGRVEPIEQPMSTEQPVTDHSRPIHRSLNWSEMSTEQPVTHHAFFQEVYPNAAQKTHSPVGTQSNPIIERNQANLSHGQDNYAGFWLRFHAYWIDFMPAYCL